MFQKKYLINFIVLLGIFLALSLFTYLLVDHHTTLPNRIDHARESLLSSGRSISDRIKRVGTVELEPSQAPIALGVPASLVIKDGETIYSENCAACHMLGIAGAPKAGDKVQWKLRIAKGTKALYSSALNGLQGQLAVMPAKGGNSTLSDIEVRNAVDHLVSLVK
jgi:cytochrome c5